MMNLSELVTSIKMDLGVYGIALPFEDSDKTIIDTINLRSIKTYSQFFPQIIKLDLDLTKLRVIKSHYNESIYEIPDVFGDRRLMYIKNVYPRNKLAGNGYMSPVMDSGVGTYQSMMMATVNLDLMSTMMPPFTFKFVEPNLLYLYNMSTMANELSVEIAVEHFTNLSSIPNTSWESFYELASLDIKRLLYNALKHHNELQTAYGNINMRIDDWANAESDRKELVEKWRDVYHLETEQVFII